MGLAILTIAFVSFAVPKDHAYAQGLTPQQRVDQCKEKNQSLQKYEKRAAELSSQFVRWNEYKGRLSGLPYSASQGLDEVLDSALRAAEADKARLEAEPEDDYRRAELATIRGYLDLLAQLRTTAHLRALTRKDVTSNPNYRKAETRIKAIEREQLVVANQISILRSALESSGCDQINGTRPQTSQLMK